MSFLKQKIRLFFENSKKDVDEFGVFSVVENGNKKIKNYQKTKKHWGDKE